MFRVLIAVALIQNNLGKPLEDGLLIPHDVEMIPVEQHGHHNITTASLERTSIEDNEIPLNEDFEGEIYDNEDISRPDRAIDTAPCSDEGETDNGADCKDPSLKTDLKQEKTEHLGTTEAENVKTNEQGQETNESVETSKDKETNEAVETNEGQKTNESLETTEGKETDGDVTNEGKETNDSVVTNEGKETNESVDTIESVETNEVVLLNQTIKMNSSAIVDGKLTIVLHFEVQDDNTIEVVSSEIVDPADVSEDIKESDDDDDIMHFSGPVHAHGKVCVAAHYGCEDHRVEEDSSEIIHHGDVLKYSNETVNDEDDDDEDEDDDDEDEDVEDDDNVHFCSPVHAQGNVCIGAHYGCEGPPISMCFSRPCVHGQHFTHPTSGNDHDFQEDEDNFAHCQYRCPNIACQYYPGSCGPFRIPEYHFDIQQVHDFDHNDQDYNFDRHHDQFDRHHNHYGHKQDHHFDHHQNHHFDHSQIHLYDHQGQDFDHSQIHLYDHQGQDFDHYQDKFDHSHEQQYEDFEEYFTRVMNSGYDSGEEDFLRWLPFSGYVPASGTVKIAAKY